MKPGLAEDFLSLAEASFAEERAVKFPTRKSFEEFLLNDARVPTGHGVHERYSFTGREALRAVVCTLDKIIGGPGPGLADAEMSLAGGAQFGKTTLELNLAAYLTGQRFRNFGLYLPNDDLVDGIVDAKFRPDVVDQIEWFAEMVQVGKALNHSGRAVNRKGAFLVMDGKRRAVGMVRGLGKVPTAFSMDAAMMDEVDDIQPRMMKFVRGRLAASDLRFILQIGTQRIHGRGMNKAWKDGSQGVFVFECPKCGRRHNAEEEFPGIVRLRIKTTKNAKSTKNNPRLSWAGDFKFDGDEVAAFGHEPVNKYYLGCVDCGAELDRSRPIEVHRQPALITQRKWSYRISQLAIAAIDLSQIVGRFQLAVADPEEMVVFRCDVLALPQSTAQALTPAILERARAVEVYELELAPRLRNGNVAFGGLDMGDRCWLFARDCSPQGPIRLMAAQKIAAGDVVAQAQAQFHRMGLSALFIDERPLVNEARSIALTLNGLQSLTYWPRIANEKDCYIELPGGLTWDGRNSRWINLRCAVVRFTKNKLGAGIEQSIVFFEEGGQTKFVPCIACNRFETIDRVVREFLTPVEGVVEVLKVETFNTQQPKLGLPITPNIQSNIRTTPAMLLPRMGVGHPPILDTVEAHLIAGSERVKEPDGSLGDYVDGCENHFLLANGYSALAQVVCGGGQNRFAAGPILLFENTKQSRVAMERMDRSVIG